MTAPALHRELAQICWDGGSLDGGELQDLLVRHGVLVPVMVDKPCGEECNCAGIALFPTICYRLTHPAPSAGNDGLPESYKKFLAADAVSRQAAKNEGGTDYEAKAREIAHRILFGVADGEERDNDHDGPWLISISQIAREIAPALAQSAADERERCAEIVSLARFGEIDTDFRTIIDFINDGLSIERIKELTK